jgi:hypothetical protein
VQDVSADATIPPAQAGLTQDGLRPELGTAPPTQDETLAPPDAAQGFVAVAVALWNDLHGAISERARLIALELRLAGLTLARLVVYAVMVAVLVITAWLGLMGAVVVEFVHFGLSWGLALALGVLINLAIAAWLVRSMVKMVERMGLPAALRSIEGK